MKDMQNDTGSLAVLTRSGVSKNLVQERLNGQVARSIHKSKTSD